jgi:hypothetical protein
MKKSVFTRVASLALFIALAAAISTHATPGAAPSHVDPAAGTVVAIQSMRAARSAHTATTLPNGNVLIAGGFTNEASAAFSAELFDPGTQRFIALPRLKALRHSHTATVLPSGKVLIVGGYGSGSAVITTAELFDPVTKTFALTGSLRGARAGHVAVPLQSGKVLIAGGVGPNWTFLSSAELYDPATGTFTPTGAMTVARESHASALLDDGRVAIIGGHRDRRSDIVLYTSVEVYDPVRGLFTKIGDMRVRRHKHDAILLGDNKVLITGGSDERDSDGAYNSTEIFDMQTGTSVMGPRMKLTRYKHQGSSVRLSDGRILIAGGAASAEVYDPKLQAFELIGGEAGLTGQFSASASMRGGRALITGGYGPRSGPGSGAWVFAPRGER